MGRRLVPAGRRGGQEPAGRHGRHPDEHHSGHQQLGPQFQADLSGPAGQQPADDAARRPQRVEARDDRRATAPLELDRLGVHRHVGQTVERADQDQGGEHETALGATPISGRATDSPADVSAVIVRLPKRSTIRPLTRLAARPPTPLPTSAMPSAVSETSMRSWISGRRGNHEANVTPLTKKTKPMATRADRERPAPGSVAWGVMAAVTIYHNPRCTKSRQAMAVADELGVDVDVVRYLDDPPDAATLRAIVDKLEGPVDRSCGATAGTSSA